MPIGVFAPGDTFFRRFDAVIQTVAHQMSERIADFLDQALIQLGAFADDLQLHLFLSNWRARPAPRAENG